MLSGEEENYMRLFMLLDICKKAVKIYFDEEFEPNHLNQTIKKARSKLLQLKKTNVLSETQWIILQGNKLDSSDFDIPLMICLLRNLADLPISDLMPLESQTKKTDELARIKFYRNAIVHGNRSNLSDKSFQIIWETICKAIRGLSDELFEECESLYITEMDLLNKDINIRIQNAFKELPEFNKLHAKLRKEWEIQQEKKTNPIPPNLRGKMSMSVEEENYMRKKTNPGTTPKGKMSMSGEEENYMRKKTNPGTTPPGNMLSGEEENYMRLFMLLDICKKAVKIFFDEEFDPDHLNQTIKKAGRKLLQLKKTNVLLETQWIILQGNKLDSSDFDIPLMICLLRNLADLPISNLMPLESQAKKTDELARINCYRNVIVHGNRSDLSDGRFLIIWETICKAIRGISDELFEECESLHITDLDLLNKDINIRIQNAFKELSESNKLHAKLWKEWEIQQQKKTNPIPPNIRVIIDKQLKRWREDNENYFVNTKGSEAVIESIKEQPCVAVTGSFGIGKTAVIHNAALLMRSNGYIVVPVTDPSEIKKYKHPVEKNLFVVDNFCGICDLEEEELEAWNNCGVEFDEKCKLLVSCKLQVYRAIRHESLNNITFHECNLLSNTLCLSLDERQSIARKYDINTLEIIDYIEYFNCFPLLCNNFTIAKIDNAQDFFKHPFEVFETQFEMLRAVGANGKVCALMILLMFYDNVPEAMITGNLNWDVKYIKANTSKACKLGTKDSCITIHKELDNLIDTYFIKKEGVYHALNEKIFNIILHYFGHEMTVPLISYACPTFIRDRFQLSNPLTNKEDYKFLRCADGKEYPNESFSSKIWDQIGLNAVVLNSIEDRKLYVNRMFSDWSKGLVNNTMKNPNFHHFFFFEFLIGKDKIEIGQLLKKKDIIDGSTSLIAYCAFTDFEFADKYSYDIYLKWLIDNGCPINGINKKGETSIFCAAIKGKSKMVNILINNKADTNICTTEGQSPLFTACMNGYCRIADILLISGANFNVRTTQGNTPLHAACSNGHISIVTELLKRNADLSIRNNDCNTPLDLARINGHHDIVQEIIKHSYTN